ncbi:MAG: hypothetical protein KatS3mg008_1959 [Acidimicrobiales bacterium]|nr:MAG: hypothetical protein KatS3mg008_1959 [Acidimicrobiales bacterium]
MRLVSYSESVSSGFRDVLSSRLELGEEWSWLSRAGLRRGRVISLGGDAALPLAFALGAAIARSGAREEGWVAFAGSRVLCAAAAFEMGVRPERFVVVRLPHPHGDSRARPARGGDSREGRGRGGALGERSTVGERSAGDRTVLSVCAALLDVFDVVVWAGGLPRRGRALGALEARLRRSGASLLYVGGRLEGEEGRLEARTLRWVGLGRGAGHLMARLVEVRPSGRLVALGAREVVLWLPDERGRVCPATAEGLAGEAEGAVRMHVVRGGG